MIANLVDFIKRKIIRDQKARWNYQYARGQWEGLKNGIELERQEIVKDFFLRYKGNGNVIELGCGYGVLPEVIFKKQHYDNYLGVDISDFMVQKIQYLADNRHSFEVGDINNYTFKQQYDAIIYNEVLNYGKDIPAILTHAQNSGLKKDGIFIISIHQFKGSPQIWKDIHDTLQVLDSKTIANSTNRWQIEVLKPR